MQLFQCVPNFSEGRDRAVIDALVAAASGERLHVVDASADEDHHRCVITLVGEGAALVDVALRMAAVAVERIDLRRHHGAHPRMGALDVLPFVPLTDSGATMAEAVALSRRAGERIAAEIGVPVFLYEEAATRPDRRNLATVRGNGFEAMAAQRIAADYGPDCVHPSAGATAVGARGPLLAFNVWLRSDDIAIAREIAAVVRERDGGLPGVKALGLALASRGCVQVSMNLTRPAETSLLAAFDAVQREAASRGVAVRRSELIGACRLADVLPAAGDRLAGEIGGAQVLDLAIAELRGG